MKELRQITHAEFELLCYIKGIAIENLRGFRCDIHYAISSVIDILIDAHKSVFSEEEE